MPALRTPLLCGVLVLIGALLVVAVERAPAAKPKPDPPLIGYNDDFNRFELHRRNDPRLILPPFDDLPVKLPLPGGEDESEPKPARAALIERAREGGAKVIRYAVPWVRVERERGSYDFSHEDQTYELALAAGLRPLIVLLTAPCWAHPSVPCDNSFRTVRPDPEYLDEFAAFARAVIERYPRAAAFEVWNESNFRAFWGPRPSPRTYVRMLAAVAKQAAQLGDHPPLLYNGLIPTGKANRYLKRSYRRFNAAKYSDGTALHPYVGDKGALAARKKLRIAKRILRRSGAPRRLWITEAGWSTTPGAAGAVSPAGQARRVARLERAAASTRAAALIVHRLKDVEHPIPWERGLGALYLDERPKPLFCHLGLRYGPGGPPRGC
jgi:hypothetical protein